MKQNQKRNRPAFRVFVIEGEGDNAFWTPISSVWPHDDGEGFNINLTAHPIGSRLVLRKPKDDDREGAR